MSRHGKFGRLLVGAKDGGNLLREGPLREALALHGLVVNITVGQEDGEGFSYEDICATWEGKVSVFVTALRSYLAVLYFRT